MPGITQLLSFPPSKHEPELFDEAQPLNSWIDLVFYVFSKSSDTKTDHFPLASAQ